MAGTVPFVSRQASFLGDVKVFIKTSCTKLVLDNLNSYVAQNLHKLHEPWLTDEQ